MTNRIIRVEWKKTTKHILQTAGYHVIVVVGGYSVFDFVGVSEADIVLVMVRNAREGYLREKQRLERLLCPSNCCKEIHLYRDGFEEPEIIEVETAERVQHETRSDIPHEHFRQDQGSSGSSFQS